MSYTSEEEILMIEKYSLGKIVHSLAGLTLKDDLDPKPYKLPDLHEVETA